MYQKQLALTSNEIFSDDFIAHPVIENDFISVLKKISNHENGAVGECLECYGNFVWAIAKKYTRTTTDAETAVREIFIDIWENAGSFDYKSLDEQSFIARIALRRLLKINEQGRNL